MEESPFKDNRYTRWYYSIINKAKSKLVYDGYTENHHIIPECMGGLNHEENMVRLSFKEHFIVHLLLIRMCKNNLHKAKMMWTICMFSKHKLPDRKFTSGQFTTIKNYTKIAFSGVNSPNYGRKMSEETKRKISLANSGENNGMYGNGVPHSEDRKRKIRISNLNKKRSDETKRKISEYQSEEICFVSIETNEIKYVFNNCREAAEFLGCNKSNITNALRTNRIVGKKLKTLDCRCNVKYLKDY